jgi:hypothetical protein
VAKASKKGCDKMYGNDFMKYKDIRDALNAEVVGGEDVDVVNSPPHYTAGGIEAIDAIEAALSDEGFRGALKANVLKYMWRYEKKADPVADLRKARWYLDRLIAAQEKIRT